MSRRNYHAPEFSCPHIDEAINEMEKTRKINEDLRDWGQSHADRVEELEQEVANLEATVKELEAKIEAMEFTE